MKTTMIKFAALAAALLFALSIASTSALAEQPASIPYTQGAEDNDTINIRATYLAPGAKNPYNPPRPTAPPKPPRPTKPPKPTAAPTHAATPTPVLTLTPDPTVEATPTPVLTPTPDPTVEATPTPTAQSTLDPIDEQGPESTPASTQTPLLTVFTGQTQDFGDGSTDAANEQIPLGAPSTGDGNGPAAALLIAAGIAAVGVALMILHDKKARG